MPNQWATAKVACFVVHRKIIGIVENVMIV